MSDLYNFFRDNFHQFDGTSALDVVIISLIFFWILMLLRGTTAMAVMRGAFIILIAALALGRAFNLRVLNFLIANSFTGLLIALPIIFQPEIRRALERVGRTGARAFGASVSSRGTIDAVLTASTDMAKRHTGALVVVVGSVAVVVGVPEKPWFGGGAVVVPYGQPAELQEPGAGGPTAASIASRRRTAS